MLKQIQNVTVCDDAVNGTYVAKWDANLSHRDVFVESGIRDYLCVRRYDVSVDDGVAVSRVTAYRAAFISECQLTGLVHCDLRTDLLVAEAQAEANHVDLAGDIEIKWCVC